MAHTIKSDRRAKKEHKLLKRRILRETRVAFAQEQRARHAIKREVAA